MEWLVEARGNRTQQSVADEVGMSQSGMPLLRQEPGGPPSIWPSGSQQCWDSNGPDFLRRTRSRTPGGRGVAEEDH